MKAPLNLVHCSQFNYENLVSHSMCSYLVVCHEFNSFIVVHSCPILSQNIALIIKQSLKPDVGF